MKASSCSPVDGQRPWLLPSTPWQGTHTQSNKQKKQSTGIIKRGGSRRTPRCGIADQHHPPRGGRYNKESTKKTRAANHPALQRRSAANTTPYGPPRTAEGVGTSPLHSLHSDEGRPVAPWGLVALVAASTAAASPMSTAIGRDGCAASPGTSIAVSTAAACPLSATPTAASSLPSSMSSSTSTSAARGTATPGTTTAAAAPAAAAVAAAAVALVSGLRKRPWAFAAAAAATARAAALAASSTSPRGDRASREGEEGG